MLWSGFVLIRFVHLWTIDIGWLSHVCCSRVYYYSIHFFYCELPSASHRVRHTRAAVMAHRWELDVELDADVTCLFTFVHRIVYQMLSLSLVRWVAPGELSTAGCFAELFFPVFSGVGACGVAQQLLKHLFVLSFLYDVCFNNNNY